MGLQETLNERGARYGDFTDHAKVAQGLQNEMRQHAGWNGLSDMQKQALTVIADKIARVLTGDPNYADNWHDIQGYARLVEERLPTAAGVPGRDRIDWVEWTGGECPVPKSSKVEVKLKDGSRIVYLACALSWKWLGTSGPHSAGNITAYRVLP